MSGASSSSKESKTKLEPKPILMQQQTKILLLFMFLWLVQKAQGQSGKRAENTILKIDRDQNPYSKRQTNWLVKNGFDANNYHWQNPNINRQIRGAFDQRTGAQVWGVIAATSGALAVNNFIKDKDGIAFYFSVSVTSILISNLKLKKTKKRVRQIDIWNHKEEPVKDSLQTMDVIIDDDFHLYSPYSISQNRYLTRNNFDIQTYDWSDPEINLYLKKSLNNRTASNVTIGVGVGLMVLNLAYNVFGELVHVVNDNSEGKYQPATTLYWIGGGIIGSSIAFRLVSIGQIEKANRLKRK